MRWRKHGVVWQPDGTMPWARAYATCPTPLTLPDGTLRVFVQCRDEHNVGRISFVDLDPQDPRRVLRVAEQAVLDVGTPGSFDDNGVFQTSVISVPDGRVFMYYVGFELCHHIRYRLLTGLAISEDGGHTFTRHKATPILERSPTEQHFRCGPCVRFEDGHFRMWYVAGSQWEVIEGKAMPIYDIRYMASPDGIHWPEEGRVVLPVSLANEHGFGRPDVHRSAAGWRMHYSIRQRSPARYRLGYAESPDGLQWQRQDERIGLDVSPDGWDADALEYSAEIEAAGRTWLLYNGNDFGVTGFGIAELLER
jgi:predicted GH43/DUF377 family glycosyl hydrolase